jgi:alkyldihydroxyacetonephosphate synthase
MNGPKDGNMDHSASFRDGQLKWNGWGYKDSYFFVNSKRIVEFTGDRYDISGKTLPYLGTWMEQILGVDTSYRTPSQKVRSFAGTKESVLNEAFLAELGALSIRYSTDRDLCYHRSHGHTVHDLIALREGSIERIVDLVVWPKCHDEVVNLVKTAVAHNVCLIPIGGGTSVTNALNCPTNEDRCIVSVDMSQMVKILWTDEATMSGRAEAGIIGQDLERLLNVRGFTLGHEPDSVEFSSLGGWVATRASGMKKNKYGNIEDLIVHVTMVTAKGVLQKGCQVPRISSGPDWHHVILGSEGCLGIVTEVTFKIFPLPAVKRYGSVLFPSFSDGVDCMREVAAQRCAPASIRLVDNEQFVFGQALKPAPESYLAALSGTLKKLYVTRWKGFNVDEMCAMTVVFEGSEEEVVQQENRIYSIAKRFKGLPAGEENGRYGYMLTFAIAYLRDFGMEYSVIGESFETSVPWDRVLILCRRVKRLLRDEKEKHDIKYPIYASARVTQVYDTGVCIYFYFGFNSRGMSDPLHVYDAIERAARDEIIACGGSISHHHGVGKIRKTWYPATVGQVGLSLFRALKRELDPQNTFGAGNLLTEDETADHKNEDIAVAAKL